MKKNMLRVLDQNGEFTGEYADRGIIHRTGAWHKSVHMWLLNKNLVLLQKRAPNKESFPGLFDASVAGHVEADETTFEAVCRETFEELGIDIIPEKITFAGVHILKISHPERGFLSNEFNYVYIYQSDFKDLKFIPDNREIADLAWEDISVLARKIKESSENYCIQPAEFALIQTAIN